jgi:hypothetical protein
MHYRALCRTGTNTWEWKADPITFVVLGDPAELSRWERGITTELNRPRYDGGRVELLGDFPTDAYLTAWLDIARAVPAVEFHAHTTQVDRLTRLAEPDAPDNFRWTYPDDDIDAARRGQDTEGQAADSGTQ